MLVNIQSHDASDIAQCSVASSVSYDKNYLEIICIHFVLCSLEYCGIDSTAILPMLAITTCNLDYSSTFFSVTILSIDVTNLPPAVILEH